jgi:hypothetical protein
MKWRKCFRKYLVLLKRGYFKNFLLGIYLNWFVLKRPFQNFIAMAFKFRAFKFS